MKKFNIDNISYRRINEIIIAVNNDIEESDIGLRTEDEKGYYDHLMEEKAKAMKEDPDIPCIFQTVEYDYDDSGLDIYND